MNQSTQTKPKRRWLQFSIRTVLVIVTLLCVGLSLWVVPGERQRRAVEAIDALNGVWYLPKQAASESFPVAFLRRWLPAVYFDEVVYVGLHNTQMTDSTLAYLEGLTDLQELDLDNTQVTDAGLAHLQGLTGLQFLRLGRTQVTDDGLVHLVALTGLETIHLDQTQITDDGLLHLKRLTSLQELYLDDTQITDAGLVHLQELTDLQVLDLDNTQVTDAGLAQLNKALPNCNIIPGP